MQHRCQQRTAFSKQAINLYSMEWFRAKGNSMSSSQLGHRQRFSLDTRFENLSPLSTTYARQSMKRELSPTVLLLATQPPLKNKHRPMSQSSNRSLSFNGSRLEEIIDERRSEKSRTKEMITKVEYRLLSMSEKPMIS